MNNDYHISNIFLQLHLLVEQCSSEFIDAWYHLYSFFQFLQMGMIKESIKQFTIKLPFSCEYIKKRKWVFDFMKPNMI